MIFVFSLLGCVGITIILTLSKIFDSIRPKHDFFHCPMCVGFHVGWIAYLIMWCLNITMFPNVLLGAFLFAGSNSVMSWILAMLGIYLEEKAHGN